MEKDRIADQVFNLTKDFLMSINEWDKAQDADERREMDKKEHAVKISWSLRQLFRKEVISVYDVMYLSPVEKDEVNYGFKRRKGGEGESKDEKAVGEVDEEMSIYDEAD